MKRLLSYLLAFILLPVPFAVARGEEGPEILKSETISTPCWRTARPRFGGIPGRLIT